MDAGTAKHYCSGCVDYTENRTMLCSRCKAAWFCGKECQTRSWATHKKICKDTLIWTNPAPSSRLSKDRMTAYMTGLSSPDAAAIKSTLTEMAEALRSKKFTLDAVGHMGALPILTRLSKKAEVREACLDVLCMCLEDQKTNASLFFLCGGTRQLADLLFLPASPPQLSDVLTPLLLSSLMHAIAAAADPAVSAATLSRYNVSDVLVPRLLGLMGTEEGKGGGVEGAARAHAAATKLLTFCITLDAEVPVVTWKAGFRVVRSLVGHYHLGVEGVDKATAAEILVDVMALIQGFVEHFPHAVDAILPDGLSAVLGELLLSGVRPVKLHALRLCRLSLTHAGSLSTLSTLASADKGRMLQQASLIAHESFEARDLDLLRQALALLTHTLHAPPSATQPHADSMLAVVASLLRGSLRDLATVLEDAVLLLRSVLLFLGAPAFTELVLPQEAFKALPRLVAMSPHVSQAVLDLFTLMAQQMGPEGLAYLRELHVFEAASKLFTSTELPDRDPLVPAEATLRALILADPDYALPKLRDNAKLKERLSGLAASDPTFAFLSSVAQGQDPSATKLSFTDWVDLAGLRRSVTRSVADARLLPYLRVRKEDHCSFSGAAFQEGDPIVRADKCLHWALTHQVKTKVLALTFGEGAEAAAEGQGPWSVPSTHPPRLSGLACPLCDRAFAVEIND